MGWLQNCSARSRPVHSPLSRGRPHAAGSSLAGWSRLCSLFPSGLGYDPYNPELPKPPSQRENGTLGLGEEPRPDVLELELVNKAIEAVRSEVELEQRRYRELLETAREHRAAEAPDAFPLTFDYSPSSHGLLSPDTGYQPTPLATPAESGSKYLLASLDRGQGRGGGGGGALEYVPKAVSQPRRHSRPVPSGKYVVDNSRPPTDLEYDPLSNYSARHLSRASSRDERAAKRPRGPRSSEPHTPAPKKPCDPFSSCDARFSDSEDEATTAPGNGPTTASTPKARADPESKATGQPPSKEGLEAEGGGLRETKETAVQCDVGDFQPPPAKPGSPAQVQASQDGGCPKEGKPKKKKSGTPPAPSCKDGTQRKDKTKDKGRGRPVEKPRADKKGPQASSPRHKAERSEGTKKKPSSATPVASSGKRRPDRPARRPSPTSGDSRPVASRGPPRPLQLPDRKSTKAPSGKLVERKARSLDEGASQDAPKLKKRALSHADLFGDESEDEAAGPGVPSVWPPALPSLSSDSDSDSDSSLGFPEARGPPKRLKASPPPSPSCGKSGQASVVGGQDPSWGVVLEEVSLEAGMRVPQKAPKKCRFWSRGWERTFVSGKLPGRAWLLSKDHSEQPAGLETLPPWRCPGDSPAHPMDPRTLQATLTSPPQSPSPPTGAKRTLAASGSQPSNGPEPGGQQLKTRTLSGMASKTTTTITPKRIAHSPSLQSLKKPIIPKEFGGKVPTVIRQRYLNLFIEECLKFCTSNQEAIEKALNEEKVAYDRSPSKNIYLNVAVNTLKKLRGLAPSAVPGLSKTGGRRVVSHEVVLGGRLATKTSFSLSRPSSPRVEDLKGAALYSRLKEYLLTQDQLKENGYPFPHPERPGGAVIFTAEEKRPKDSSCRTCCRCGTEYLVSSSGRCVRDEECYYHWGRLRRNRVAGGWETQYMCCSAAAGSVGCQVAKQHVQDGRKERLEGFVKTFEKELSGDTHPGIYALDCEMSYTTYGLELTRVTVVDTDVHVVYDTFVKPDNEIVDYNTRFSGVTEADLADTSVTLRDVQAVLLSMFSADTILIGHSLESDLLALKVIHSTVVDTAVLFPHYLGLPYKRSLRNLAADYLGQIIQDN
uniref:Exonuclease domain-containing protein n=1 Tax=Colobus angolensis palliatus TaxID=336983 RepID=A0A2K5JKQ1_COLAP